MAFAIALAGVVSVLKPLAPVLRAVVRLALRPFRGPDADEAHRIQQRKLFAGHVERQLDHLAGKEDWRDERFAELEAEVEAEGRERVVPWLRRLSPARTVTLRREKSLSRALARSQEPLVILEGDPGAGKSVALRHLAQQLAHKAREVRNAKTATFLIPLYINLKECKPAQGPVDGPAVRQFILDSLNRINDRDVEAFLEEEFDRGLQEGTWLLLLDSFDEIPEVLSSTESDSVVEEYALAIRDFLSGMKQCRAVIASREFRGPRALFRVPRFRVLSLSARQQRDLIQRSGLKPAGQGAVHLGLASADPELRQLAKNPMFLSLVCEYVRREGKFPPNSNAAYESYLNQRLARDEVRIQNRYAADTALVREVAECTAYCMAAVTGLGLTPTRRELCAEISASTACATGEVEKALDALEYTKLGRSPDDLAEGAERRFTFAHRRFQEYFATQVVLRNPDLVSSNDLLTNGRWRETAVTILQTQSADVVVPMLDEAGRLLASMIVDADRMAVGPLFSWPAGCLHLLQLLDAGMGRAPDGIPRALRVGVGRLLRTAWERGRRHNRRMAVSLALIADRDTAIWLINQAFDSGSVLLAGEAYSCVSRLASPPQGLYRGVRRALLDMASSGQLNEEHLALKAQVSRLPEPAPLLRVLRMLTAAHDVDLVLGALIITCTAIQYPALLYGVAPLVLFAFPGFRFMFTYPRLESGKSLESGPVIPALSLMARIMLAITGIPWLSNVHEGGFHLTFAICADVFIFYFVIWGFAVRSACLNGSPTRVTGWPWVPIFLLGRGVRALVQHKNRKIIERLFLVPTILTLGLLALYYLLYLLIGSSVESYQVIVFFALTIGAIILFVIRTGRWYGHDWKVVRSLKKKRALPDSDELLSILEVLRTGYGYSAVLNVMCETNLDKSSDITRIISDLAFVIERGKIDRDSRDLPIPGLGPEVAKWLDAYRKRKRDDALYFVTDAALDRIARTVEAAEVARQSETVKLRHRGPR